MIVTKNWLGNKQWRAVNSIKLCEKWLPLKWLSYWEGGKFSLKVLRDFKPEAFYKEYENTQFFFCATTRLSFIATSMTDWVKMSTDLLFHALCWIHCEKCWPLTNVVGAFMFTPSPKPFPIHTLLGSFLCEDSSRWFR